MLGRRGEDMVLTLHLKLCNRKEHQTVVVERNVSKSVNTYCVSGSSRRRSTQGSPGKWNHRVHERMYVDRDLV